MREDLDEASFPTVGIWDRVKGCRRSLLNPKPARPFTTTSRLYQRLPCAGAGVG